MASGILGQSALSATTETTVYTVPASTLAIVNVNVVNRSASADATVRVALASTAIPQDSEWIEYGVSVPPGGVIERAGIALNAAKRVIVYASTANCSASVYGLEQSV
jgi:hypothetical protein